MEDWKLSPCRTCTRVKDPAACENKNCRRWRQWFSCSWDKTCSSPVLQMQLRTGGTEGVSIGGTRYLHPDRVREYLQQDPCSSCPFPGELCTSPCPAKRAWVQIKQEVTEHELEK